MPKPVFIPQKLRPWIEARRRFSLSHAQIQMARELGLNPKKLGGMANHKQERWKMPLPLYIEHLYKKQLGKDTPDDVRSIEIKVREKRARKEAKNRTGVANGSRRGHTLACLTRRSRWFGNSV